MRNVDAEQNKNYYINAINELEETFNTLIPNFTLMPSTARFRINDSIVEFSSAADNMTFNPVVSATRRFRQTIADRIKDNQIYGTRLFVQGGPQGVSAVQLLLDTQGQDVEQRLTNGIQTPFNHDRYIHLLQLPPFVDKRYLIDLIRNNITDEDKDLEKILNYQVDIPSGDKLFRMATRFKELATGAIITNFKTSDGAWIDYEYLSPDYLGNYASGEAKAKPKLLAFMSRGDDHLGSQHNKLVYISKMLNQKIVADKEMRERAEEVMGFDFMNNLIRVNRLENGVYSLFPHYGIFYNGDNVQGMNYPTIHVEKFKDLNQYAFSKMLSDKEIAGLTKEELVMKALCDKYWNNESVMQDQLDDFEEEMILHNKDQRILWINEVLSKGIVGPIITYIAGSHTKHTFNTKIKPTGLFFNKELAKLTRYAYGLRGTENEDIIQAGEIGSGTGYINFEWGLPDAEYRIIQKHKWSSTHKDQVAQIMKTMIDEQRNCDWRLGGHTHHPLILFLDDETVLINGSVQGDNEWKEMLSLPPSTTTSHWVRCAAEGLHKGPRLVTPLTLELMMAALKDPLMIKERVQKYYNFY